MDLLSKIVRKEEAAAVPSRKIVRENPVDHLSLAILLERAGYLRKLAALGEGMASETLKEYPQHSTMLYFRSRDGDAESHKKFAVMFHVLDGRATLVSGREIVGAQAIAAGENNVASLNASTRQELRAGDVVHIPVGLPYQILVGGEKTVTYLLVKMQEIP